MRCCHDHDNTQKRPQHRRHRDHCDCRSHQPGDRQGDGQLVLQLVPAAGVQRGALRSDLFALETGIGSFIFFGCTGFMGWVLLFNRAGKYDESDGAPIEGNTKLEITWTVIPLLLVFAIAFTSMKVNATLNALGPKQKYPIGADTNALIQVDPSAQVGPIQVIARQWSWEFIYPNGVHSSELHLPIDQRVNLQLQSEDVIHSFYVPAFRLKQDIVPGSLISYSLTPTRPGRYRLRDAMFSGAYMSVNQSQRDRRIGGGVLRLAEAHGEASPPTRSRPRSRALRPPHRSR